METGGGTGWGQRGKEEGGHESTSNEGVLGREKPQIYGSHKLNSMLSMRADPHFLCQCKHERKSESGTVRPQEASPHKINQGV